MKDNKKVTLILIIVLLVIFVPLTVLGFIFKNIHIVEENPNHHFIYNGHLWFYNNRNELMSKYECKTDVCELTRPIIDDGQYELNHYKDGIIDRIPILGKKYVFITDGTEIIFNDITLGKKLGTYYSVKTYNVKNENDIYILQKMNGLWGVISITENKMSPVIPFEYNFIGLANHLNEDGSLKNSNFVVMKNSEWFIIDKDNKVISSKLKEQIIDYNSDYVITRNGNSLKITGFDGNEYLEKYKINDYILFDEYIGIITNNYLHVFEKLNEDPLKSIQVDTKKKIKFQYDENNDLNIISGDKVLETLELS